MTKINVIQNILGISIAVAAVALIAVIAFLLFGRLTARDRSALIESHQTIEVGERTRKYRFYSPDPNKKLPLVVVLHSYNYDSGRISELYTGWSNLAKETGEFAVVYPEGVGRSWNGGFCCGYAYARNIDDVTFISHLINKLSSENNLNAKRYATGFSNGSFLVQRLISDQPELFDAAAAVMTGIGDDSGNRLDITGATTPLFLVTGSQDSYTNHDLDKVGFRFTPKDVTVEAWREQLQVSLTSENSSDNYSESVYSTEDGQTKLVYRLYDEQHRWPQWRLWTFNQEVSPFTRELWQQLQLLSQ